jgi:hypothetical protein
MCLPAVPLGNSQSPIHCMCPTKVRSSITPSRPKDPARLQVFRFHLRPLRIDTDGMLEPFPPSLLPNEKIAVHLCIFPVRVTAFPVKVLGNFKPTRCPSVAFCCEAKWLKPTNSRFFPLETRNFAHGNQFAATVASATHSAKPAMSGLPEEAPGIRGGPEGPCARRPEPGIFRQFRAETRPESLVAILESPVRAAAMESGTSFDGPKTQAEPSARSALQQRLGSVGQCGLDTRRKADMPQRRASRAETAQPRPVPRAPASVPPRSHHGSRHSD